MGLGRIGNFIDGQIVGSVTGVWWAVKFPDAEGFRHPLVIRRAEESPHRSNPALRWQAAVTPRGPDWHIPLSVCFPQDICGRVSRVPHDPPGVGYGTSSEHFAVDSWPRPDTHSILEWQHE